MTQLSDAPVLPAASAPRRDAAASVCAHCGLPVPRGLVVDDEPRQFCCSGCRTVYETIHACGLDAYYRLREAAGEAAAPARASGRGYEAFDNPAFREAHTQPAAGGLRRAELLLEGVHCVACVWLVERLPRVLPGVAEARLNLRESVVRITWDDAALPLSRIALTLDRLGYPPHPARGGSKREVRRRAERRQLARIGIAGACAGNTMLLAVALYAGMFGAIEDEFATFFRWLSTGIGLVSIAWPGSVFFRGAWAAIRTRTPNLDAPIALGIGTGAIAGAVNTLMGTGDIYFDSLSVLVFLLLVGRYVQGRQQRWAADAVELLFSLTPATCRVVRGGDVVECAIESLAEDDLVEVRPGDLFPSDGVVADGASRMNQALLTGESAPVAVETGGAVFAGAQNLVSTLRVRVTAVGEATRVGQLMRLVEEGVSRKPPIVQFADRVAGWFLLVVSVLAAGVFLFWSLRAGFAVASEHTVALLVVSCPCALGLATPLTMSIATARAARQGILIKDAAALEKLARRGLLLLDKTGTLTEGRAKLVAWHGPASLRPVVAAVEAASSHPVAQALAESLGDAADIVIGAVEERGDGGLRTTWDGRDLLVGSPTFIGRAGVDAGAFRTLCADEEAAGRTVVLVALEGEAVAAAVLGDALRESSAPAVSRLARLGWRPRIVSGDARGVVAHVAGQVGIDAADAHGQVSPEQKLAMVRDADGPGRVTVMVGDGVNDAAALAAADVGIAVHGGAEASLAAADVYIARPGLSPIVELVELSRRTLGVVHRNLAVSLSYNAIAVSLAAVGWINPLVAAVLMPLSSGSVVALAVASLGRWKGGGPCR